MPKARLKPRDDCRRYFLMSWGCLRFGQTWRARSKLITLLNEMGRLLERFSALTPFRFKLLH